MDADAGPCHARPVRSEVTELNPLAAELSSVPIPSQAAAAASIGPEPSPVTSSAEFTSGGNTEKCITAPVNRPCRQPTPHTHLDPGLPQAVLSVEGNVAVHATNDGDTTPIGMPGLHDAQPGWIPTGMSTVESKFITGTGIHSVHRNDCMFIYDRLITSICYIRVMEVPRAADRRVRRSRSALMRAAIALVSERGTADVAVSEIAETADVSRQLVYQHFGDRDALLLAAAVDLAERELLPHVAAQPESIAGKDRRLLIVVGHFAQHHSFYRAVLNGSRSFELTSALSDMLSPLNQQLVGLMCDAELEPQVVEDLSLFVTAGWGAVINRWLMEDADSLDVHAFSQRLMDIFWVIVGAATGMTTGGPRTSPGPASRPSGEHEAR